jgi:thiosulfate reductase cytochrome b subunit
VPEAPSSAAAAAPRTPTSPSAAREEQAPQKPPARESETIAAKPAEPRSRKTNLLLGALGLLAVALAAVFFTRWFVTLSFMQDFLARYPGETDLPAGTEPGFPAWVQWQHFFNFFLIVLIIRSGLQVRRETRPPGYWTPKWSKGGDGRISITLWFHQALDILWLLNGLVFVVLLFLTGHWARLVPTTWEVFPNALSALIQYVSMDWPTENGWVNYNSLQMLAYFLTVFIAAPLAAISGVRMSGIWPKNAATLNRLYPVEWARAVHFPVMLYFVVFIIGHVALVFATGALRNLNHMYGGQDAVNWVGFGIFFVSLLLVIGAWIAARPVLLAPVAGLFGRVSSR